MISRINHAPGRPPSRLSRIGNPAPSRASDNLWEALDRLPASAALPTLPATGMSIEDVGPPWHQDYRADGLTLVAGRGADILHGTDRSDRLEGGAGNDKLYAGAGDDQLDGGRGSDHLDGGAGNDLLIGGDGADRLHGGDGNDKLEGGQGHDRLYGRNGDDILEGGVGNDLLEGGEGNDTLDGGPGEDTLCGSIGHDLFRGGDDKDSLDGGRGNDTLDAGAGNDTLKGGDGRDLLIGGTGDDLLEGGRGNDLYFFDSGFGRDTIRNGDAAGFDEVRFGESSPGHSSRLWFARSGDSLEVTLLDRRTAEDDRAGAPPAEQDKITLDNWYGSAAARVDLFRDAAGHTLKAAQVDHLVEAMAAFGAAPAGSESLSPPQWQQVELLIAANWS